MALRDLRLGAFLVPLAVSAVPIGVLVWYGIVHIPSQERYLNERNLRLLMTVSGNIRTKVDNFDNAIDHGVKSFWDRREKNEAKQKANLASGVRMFASDLEILEATTDLPKHEGGDTETTEQKLLGKGNDPPYIELYKDEGHWSLYVAARIELETGGVLRVLAKSDIETVVQPFLATRSEFDAVLLVAKNGDVIAQRSPIGVGLSNVNNVLKQRGDRRATDRNAPETTFDMVRDFSNVLPLSIGGADYKLYLQPVPLSLTDDGGKSEQWVVCGLVRADRFRAETSALSYPTLLWFTAALAVVVLAIPFVKVRVLRPRERLHANDAGWVAAATFVSVGLLAVAVLDVAVFDFVFRDAVDERLADVSQQISANVSAEVHDIKQQSQRQSFQNDAAFSAVANELDGSAALPTVNVSEKTPTCTPREACAIDMWKSEDDVPYRFVFLASWFDRAGRQLVKKTPGVSITPFINMKQERLEYSDAVQRAWLSDREASGVSVLVSPNTGEPLTVFWRLPADGVGTSRRAASQSLALFSPISLSLPKLPPRVSFVVVDQTGRAIFHSEKNRSLQEDFLKECEDNALLRAAIGGAPTPAFSASYLGRVNRLLVTPLPLSGELTNDPHWSLIVFQDTRVADTVNLETVTLACMLFFAYAASLAIAALLLRAVAPRGWMKWFWPANGKRRAYVGAAWLNATAAAVVIVSGAWLPPLAWLALTIAIAIGALFLTRRMIVESGRGRAPSGFGVLHPYFFARAASLLIIAVLPAIACYHVAYTFETTLLATSEDTHRDSRQARSDRIANFVNRFKLADEAARKNFVDDLVARKWDTIDARLWRRDEVVDRCATCDALLASIHLPYNDVAIDFKAAASAPTRVRGVPAELRLWVLMLVVAGLFGICFAFVFVLLRPLFGLRGVASAGPTAARVQASSRRVLIVGPPGSGKSTQLAAASGLRIFDVARSAFVERRRRNVSVLQERRRPMVAAVAVAAGAGAGWWSRWSPSDPVEAPAAQLRPVTIARPTAFDDLTLPTEGSFGIDHLDYRLDDRDFAGQTLRLLERAIQTDLPLRVVSDRDPLTWLAEYRAPAAEIDRWARALASFDLEVIAVGYSDATESTDIDRRVADRPSLSRARARDEYLVATTPHYEALWRACTADEQLALCQLAQEGMVNPHSPAVRRLMRVGLIVRDPIPRLMARSFRRFVLQTPGADDLSAREHLGVSVPWGSVKAALMTVVAGLAGLLIVTQQQLVSAWIGFVPALIPAAQRAWSLFATVRATAKGEGTA